MKRNLNGRPLKKGDKLCSLHFYPTDIIRFHDYLNINGIIIKGSPLKNPRPRPGALPHIFEGCPSYMTSPEKPKRAPPKNRGNAAAVRKKILTNNDNVSNTFCSNLLHSYTTDALRFAFIETTTECNFSCRRAILSLTPRDCRDCGRVL